MTMRSSVRRSSPLNQRAASASRSAATSVKHRSQSRQRSTNTTNGTTSRDNSKSHKKGLPPKRAKSATPQLKGSFYTSTSKKRAVDVTPVFSVEGHVRFVEVISERVAWTSDGDGLLRVRSLPKGSEIRAMRTRQGAFCTCLLFVQATGKVWAALSDGFILVFDVSTYALEKEVVQHDGAVLCMVELEKNIFTGGQDWKICQWNAQTCQYERLFFGHSNTVRCFCPFFGPTGAVLFSGGDDCTVRAWDPYAPVHQTKEDTACKHTFTGHTRGVLALEYVSAVNQLFAGGEDCTIRVWDLQTLESVATLLGHSAPVSCVKLVEHRIWSGDKHGRIFLWDIKTLSPIQELSERMSVPHKCVLSICKVLPTVGWKIWTTCSSGFIQCWNADTMSIVFEDAGSGKGHPSNDDNDLLKKRNEEDMELRNEIGRLNDELRRLREASNLEHFEERQSQQLLMDDNASLRNEVQRLKNSIMNNHLSESVMSNSFFADKDSPSHGNDNAAEPWRPWDSRTNRRSDASAVTHHEHRFSDIVWDDIIGDAPANFREAFTADAADATGLPVSQHYGILFSVDKDVLCINMDVLHSVSMSKAEIDEKLEACRYPRVMEYCAKVLSKKQQDLMNYFASDKSYSGTVENVIQEIMKVQKDNKDKISEQAQTIKTLEKKVEAKDKEKSLLAEEKVSLKKLILQLEQGGSQKTTNIQEEYEALKAYVDDRLKPMISQLLRKDRENKLDLEAYASQNDAKMSLGSFGSLDGSKVFREGERIAKEVKERYTKDLFVVNSRRGGQDEKGCVDGKSEPSIHTLKMNSEKERELEANEKIIRELRKEVETLRVDKDRLEKTLQSKAKALMSTMDAEEEFNALKVYVDCRLKPLISNLKRTNAENALDMEAYKERIKKLESGLPATSVSDQNGVTPRGQRNFLGETAGQTVDVATRLVNAEEEYEALKNYVDTRLKPLISKLSRNNSEKDLDLEAGESQIKTLQGRLKRVQQLQEEITAIIDDKQSSLEELLRTQAATRRKVGDLEEDYAALKDYLDKRLKPSLSILKRKNDEMAFDLKANEQHILTLEEKNKAMEAEGKYTGESLSRGKPINFKEEYEALERYVNDRLKPLISRVTRLNAEKSLDLEASAARIRDLEASSLPAAPLPVALSAPPSSAARVPGRFVPSLARVDAAGAPVPGEPRGLEGVVRHLRAGLDGAARVLREAEADRAKLAAYVRTLLRAAPQPQPLPPQWSAEDTERIFGGDRQLMLELHGRTASRGMEDVVVSPKRLQKQQQLSIESLN